jgi:hypothetical protein
MPWGAAAAAAGSIGSALINKNAASGASRKDTPEIQAADKLALSKATDIANRPYQSYSGSRIAELSGNENQAIGSASGEGVETNRLLGKSESALDSSQQDFNSTNLSKYMDPYTDAVLNPVIKQQNSQYDRDQAALKNSKSGAFGGDRSAFASSELERNHFDMIDKVTGQVKSDAFKQGSAAFFQDKDRQARGAEAYKSLAEGKQNLNRQQIQDLMATGGLQRLLQQSKNDFNYSQFIEQRDWDVTNLDPLLKTISAAKGNSVSTSTNKSGADLANTVIGAGIDLASKYFGAPKGDNSSTKGQSNLDSGGNLTDAGWSRLGL